MSVTPEGLSRKRRANAALSDEQVRFIRKHGHEFDRRSFADVFRVAPSTVDKILRGETYRWVDWETEV